MQFHLSSPLAGLMLLTSGGIAAAETIVIQPVDGSTVLVDPDTREIVPAVN